MRLKTLFYIFIILTLFLFTFHFTLLHRFWHRTHVSSETQTPFVGDLSTSHLHALHPDITLVTQTSLEPFRIARVKNLIHRWPGPISLVFAIPHGSGGHGNPQVVMMKQHIAAVQRWNIMITVYEIRSTPYPINFLRNLAIAQAPTEYIFYLDVDFVPSITAYQNLVNHPELKFLQETNTILILPAFDYHDGETPELIETKNDLLKMISAGKAEQFHKAYTVAHRQINYKRWMKASQTYDINYHIFFEPYFVTHRDAPLYDERFMGYFYNKVAQVYELWAYDYRFKVLPHDFVIHLNHSYTSSVWLRERYAINRDLFKEIQEEIWEDTDKIQKI